MENASKALLITGSILIGVILLSLAVYVYNIMGEAKKMETSTFTEEQLVKYNQEFLSYDKSRMYGTDVITVLNKAIDNNKRYAEDDDSNIINIKIILKDDVNEVVTTYTWDKKNGKYTSSDKSNNVVLKSGEYNLVDDMDSIKKILNTGVKTFLNEKIDNHKSYQISDTGFTEFKRMIFQCDSTKTRRNDIGKICYMEFVQYKK